MHQRHRARHVARHAAPSGRPIAPAGREPKRRATTNPLGRPPQGPFSFEAFSPSPGSPPHQHGALDKRRARSAHGTARLWKCGNDVLMDNPRAAHEHRNAPRVAHKDLDNPRTPSMSDPPSGLPTFPQAATTVHTLTLKLKAENPTHLRSPSDLDQWLRRPESPRCRHVM